MPSSRGAVEVEKEQVCREQQALVEQRVAAIRHQILVLSGKGGVGKSTCAVSLANGLADRGLIVGLLDADLHGPTVPLMTGVVDERPLGGVSGLLPVAARKNLFVMSMGFLLPNRTDPVIWRGPLRANALRQFIADVEWGPLDCLVVDLPPGTGDEPLTVAQAFPNSDGALVVTTPQEASLAACRKAINFVRAVSLPCLGVIENMSGFVCPHCGRSTDIFARGGGERMAAEMSVPFLGRVPLLPEIVVMSDSGGSLVAQTASEAVRTAWADVIEALVARAGIALPHSSAPNSDV